MTDHSGREPDTEERFFMWNQLTDPENQTREYLAAKAREMAEMEAFMKGLNENPDPCVLYRWRDAVTDIK